MSERVHRHEHLSWVARRKARYAIPGPCTIMTFAARPKAFGDCQSARGIHAEPHGDRGDRDSTGDEYRRRDKMRQRNFAAARNNWVLDMQGARALVRVLPFGPSRIAESLMTPLPAWDIRREGRAWSGAEVMVHLQLSPIGSRCWKAAVVDLRE